MSESDRRGTSIRIFLADGTPDGLRIVEKSNWTGIALMCSRKQYPEVRTRAEFQSAGVYLLSGPSEGDGLTQRIYIGEADVARDRLDSHLKNKDFWTHLILFSSKDENINKAHVKYLESKLIALALQAKRVEMDNGNAPGQPKLSEADTADTETFLDHMLQIYPLLGISAFEIPEKKAIAGPRFYLKGSGAKGEGRDADEGFVVFKGATARDETVDSTQAYVIDHRKKLLESGVFVRENGTLQLSQDYTFSSPSMAAAILMGRNANGRIEWKNGQGQTLKEIQESALGEN